MYNECVTKGDFLTQTVKSNTGMCVKKMSLFLTLLVRVRTGTTSLSKQA